VGAHEGQGRKGVGAAEARGAGKGDGAARAVGDGAEVAGDEGGAGGVRIRAAGGAVFPAGVPADRAVPAANAASGPRLISAPVVSGMPADRAVRAAVSVAAWARAGTA
jgi:hypothetical protein